MNEHAKLRDIQEFERRYIEYTKDSETYEEAYNRVESDYKKAYGKARYSNYNSFRVARSRRIKRIN